MFAHTVADLGRIWYESPVFRPELLAALILWTAPLGQPREPSLGERLVRWEAPATCPAHDRLIDAITAILGRPLADRDVAAWTADGSARRRRDGRWALTLTLRGHAGPPVVRTAIAEQCELLAETAALIVAVALDPTIAGLPPDAAPTSRAPDGVPLAVEVPAPDPVEPSARPRVPTRPRLPPPDPARPRRSVRMTLAAAAALDLGALPGPAPGLLARAGLLARRVRAELGLVHLFARPARLPDGAVGGTLDLTAAHLLAGPRLALRRVEFPVFAGLELGAMRGEGRGLPVVTADRVPWLAALAEARAQWVPVPRLALGLQLGLAVPLLTARFRVQGLADDLHRAAPVAFRGALALELRFF